MGTVDQSSNGGQWTFLAALPFFVGHPGNVTLSNEGTEPGTLAVFDKIRFTWSGKSCGWKDSHPHVAEIRMTVDFKHVSDRLPEFGSAFTAKLGMLTGVPEKALRLTDLRSGSIIAELLVLPSVVDDPLAADFKPSQIFEKLRSVVDSNAADLCALTGAPVEGCKVEFKNLGVAKPDVRPVSTKRPPQQQQEPKVEEEGFDFMILAYCALAGAALLKIVVCLYCIKSRTSKKDAYAADTAKATGNDATVSMEEGTVCKVVNEKKPAKDEVDDNCSTASPTSEPRSEPSLNGDAENTSNAGSEAVLRIGHSLSDDAL